LAGTNARRFFDQALRARYREHGTPGAGVLLRISHGIDGAALAWGDRVVHVVLQPDAVVYPRK